MSFTYAQVFRKIAEGFVAFQNQLQNLNAFDKHYKILNFIAKGTYGKVFRVRPRRLKNKTKHHTEYVAKICLMHGGTYDELIECMDEFCLEAVYCKKMSERYIHIEGKEMSIGPRMPAQYAFFKQKEAYLILEKYMSNTEEYLEYFSQNSELQQSFLPNIFRIELYLKELINGMVDEGLYCFDMKLSNTLINYDKQTAYIYEICLADFGAVFCCDRKEDSCTINSLKKSSEILSLMKYLSKVQTGLISYYENNIPLFVDCIQPLVALMKKRSCRKFLKTAGCKILNSWTHYLKKVFGIFFYVLRSDVNLQQNIKSLDAFLKKPIYTKRKLILKHISEQRLTQLTRNFLSFKNKFRCFSDDKSNFNYIINQTIDILEFLFIVITSSTNYKLLHNSRGKDTDTFIIKSTRKKHYSMNTLY